MTYRINDMHNFLKMAPTTPPQPNPNEPGQPPKRETEPLPLPMVGLGKDQVIMHFRLSSYSFKVYFYNKCISRWMLYHD